jgi:hypothetical protein
MGVDGMGDPGGTGDGLVGSPGRPRSGGGSSHGGREARGVGGERAGAGTAPGHGPVRAVEAHQGPGAHVGTLTRQPAMTGRELRLRMRDVLGGSHWAHGTCWCSARHRHQATTLALTPPPWDPSHDDEPSFPAVTG